MTTYRSRADGRYPVTLAEIRASSGMLFGDQPTQAVLDAAGVDPVQDTTPPTYDPATQMLTEGAPAQSGGSWRQTWTVMARPVDPTANFIPVPLLRQRLEKLGLFEDFSAYLAQYPVLMLKVLSLESGVDPAYPDLLAAFDTMQVPQNARAYLLAPPSVGVPDV